MLHLFRSKKQGLKWILWIVILGLGASMLLLFVDSPTGMVSTAENVAQVGDYSISAVEFQRAYNRVLEQYRLSYGEADPELLRQLGVPQQTLDGLIQEYAVSYGADAMGVGVTPEEIAEYVTSIPSLQQDGVFIGVESYKQVLKASSIGPEEFEESIRREVLRNKLGRILTAGIKATDQEIRQLFLERNQEIKIRYAAFDPLEFVPETVEDQELEAFFEERRELYRTQELRRIKYARVEQKPQEVELNEQRIQERLAGLSDKEEVRASHILLTPDNPENRSTAEELLRRLEAGEDFAELAREFSQDEATAEAGGDLGFFSPGSMVIDFERAAFALEPGELSELVTTMYGIHIIKATDVKRIDRRQEIETELRQEEADSTARNLATKIAFEAGQGGDLDSVAQRYGLAVEQTDLFSLGDVLPGLGTRSDFNQQIFALETGQFSEPYPAGNAYIVAQVTEVQPSELSELAEVRDDVVEDYKSTKAEELALERAFTFARETGGGDFATVAAQQGVSLTATDFFKKDASVDDTLGYSTEVLDRAFRMDVGDVSPAVTAAGQYVVFQVTEKSAVDEELFEQEKHLLSLELMDGKKQQFFGAWIRNVIEQLQEEDQITINQSMVDAIVG